MGRLRWAGTLLGLSLAVAPLAGACGPNAAAPTPQKSGVTQGVRKAGRATGGATNRAKHTVKRVGTGAHRALKTADKKAGKAGNKVKRTVTGARGGRAKRPGTKGKRGAGKKGGQASDHRVQAQAGRIRGAAATRARAGMSHSARPAAVAGRALYIRECASCHGGRGQGTGKGSALDPKNVVAGYRNLPALRLYIAHNMPSTTPGRLSPTMVKRIASYVWKIAGGR